VHWSQSTVLLHKQPVFTWMSLDKHLSMSPHRSTQPGHPLWVGLTSTGKRGHVNRHIMQCTDPISMVSRHKVVSGRGLHKWRSVLRYEVMWLWSTSRYALCNRAVANYLINEWLINWCLYNDKQAFEKCWAHLPLRATARPFTRRRAHRCPWRRRQRVTEGTAMAP